MSENPIEPAERRDKRLHVMLTPSEKTAVKDFADGYGMTMSNAGRFLILKALRAVGEARDSHE